MLNEVIKSTIRQISNSVIVLTSREMLMQLIHITSTNTKRAKQQQPDQQLFHLAYPQSEYDLLQLLDILYYTDTLDKYKALVNALMSSTSWSQSIARVARMSCQFMLPEFRLVKRVTWSSEDKREHDVGRIRTRVNENKTIAEDAVQFGSGGSGLASNMAWKTTSSAATNAQNLDHLQCVGFGKIALPNDIDKLAISDSSNLFILFDSGQNKAAASTKPTTTTTTSFNQINRLIFKSRRIKF